jgi:hypothetical protein
LFQEKQKAITNERTRNLYEKGGYDKKGSNEKFRHSNNMRHDPHHVSFKEGDLFSTK